MEPFAKKTLTQMGLDSMDVVTLRNTFNKQFGAKVALTDSTVQGSSADLGGAFYVQGCSVARSSGTDVDWYATSADAPCAQSVTDAGATTTLDIVRGSYQRTG